MLVPANSLQAASTESGKDRMDTDVGKRARIFQRASVEKCRLRGNYPSAEAKFQPPSFFSAFSTAGATHPLSPVAAGMTGNRGYLLQHPRRSRQGELNLSTAPRPCQRNRSRRLSDRRDFDITIHTDFPQLVPGLEISHIHKCRRFKRLSYGAGLSRRGNRNGTRMNSTQSSRP